MTMNKMNQSDIQEWLLNKISVLSRLPKETINIHAPLAEYNLDSVHAVGLSGDIEEWLGIAVEPTLAWDFPTITEMSGYLATEVAKHFKNTQIIFAEKKAA